MELAGTRQMWAVPGDSCQRLQSAWPPTRGLWDGLGSVHGGAEREHPQVRCEEADGIFRPRFRQEQGRWRSESFQSIPVAYGSFVGLRDNGRSSGAEEK